MTDTLGTALRGMIERAQLAGLGLDVGTLVVARDSVERHDRLLAAITRHHFDSTHLASKGFSLRLADRMLYDEAGLPDIAAGAS